MDLIDESLAAPRRSEILDHLQACTICSMEVSANRDLLALVRADPVPEPSPRFWEEFLPSLKRRIDLEAPSRPRHTTAAWLAALRSWRIFPRPLIAGVAVAAISALIVIRLPWLLVPNADQADTPSSIGRLVDRGGETGEPLVVAGEVLDDPSTLAAIIQRLPWVDEIADRLEYAWVGRPESDPSESLASLGQEDQQVVLDHLRSFRWSPS